MHLYLYIFVWSLSFERRFNAHLQKETFSDFYQTEIVFDWSITYFTFTPIWFRGFFFFFMFYSTIRTNWAHWFHCKLVSRKNVPIRHSVTVWKLQKFNLTEKIFRQITYLVISSTSVTFTKFLSKKSESKFP